MTRAFWGGHLSRALYVLEHSILTFPFPRGFLGVGDDGGQAGRYYASHQPAEEGHHHEAEGRRSVAVVRTPPEGT